MGEDDSLAARPEGGMRKPRCLRHPLPVGVLRWAFGWLLPGILLPVALLTGWSVPSWAAPGLCVGPVCGQEITRSPIHPWQLRLRVDDQWGRHERIVVDCRDGVISPRSGRVERGYAAAVARRACRLAPQAPKGSEFRGDGQGDLGVA
jgi:hypothetical protein